MKHITPIRETYISKDVNEALSFWGQEPIDSLNEMANVYIAWCFENNKNFADIYPEDNIHLEGLKSSLRNHFIGSLGEYFFCFLLNDRKEFDLSYNIGESIKTEFNFTNVSPRLENEDDFGVDLVGDLEYNNKKNPCAIQVKFWNTAFSNSKLNIQDRPMFTNEMASGVYTDAILNKFIDNDSKKSIVVCWTLKDENISRWLRKNSLLASKLVFLDMNVLNSKISKKSPEFWMQLKNKFNEIKNF